MPLRQSVWNGSYWHSKFSDIVAPPPPFAAWPFNADEPWRLESGETVRDGLPANANIVVGSDYSTSDDLRTVLNAVDGSSSVPVGSYVLLDANRTYWINRLYNFGTSSNPNWLGFANSNRRVMGLLGWGVGSTLVRVPPTMISDTPDARDYVLSPSQPWTPVPLTTLYFSNGNTSGAPNATSFPFFTAGIDFMGDLQTPYGVLSAEVQSAKMRSNQGNAAPLAYRGIALWRAVVGSRIQHCRFSGFGTALNSSPPYETGSLDSNYGSELVRRCEFDGRLSSLIDTNRPRITGAFMINKGIALRIEDTRMHHTRRSGWATNTNTQDSGERYYGKRVRIDNIADITDNWPMDAGSFDGSNVEAVVGIFEYESVYINAGNTNTRGHIHYAVPATNPDGSAYVLPDSPRVLVRGGFKTDDTLYGGLLRIRVSQNPNSTGQSPAWTKLNNSGIAGSNLFDIRNTANRAMIGVRHTAYDSALHKPETHFVVIY